MPIPIPTPVEVPAVPAAKYDSQGLGQFRIETDRATGALHVYLRGYPCNATAWAPTGFGDEFLIKDAMKTYGQDAEGWPLVEQVQDGLTKLFALLVERKRAEEAAKKKK